MIQLIIISGRSGSGKTIALHSLEDLGFYCVDNLPLKLTVSLLEELDQTHHQKVAISIDSRNLNAQDIGIKNLITELQERTQHCALIYLDADEQVLLTRFSETRRKHPLTAPGKSLLESIQKEKKILQPLMALADLTLDTSRLGQHQLHNLIRDRALHANNEQLQVLIQSFGFKHGLPQDADFIFDVRCLPNPYWHKELRNLTGCEEKIKLFLQDDIDVKKMLSDIYNFIIYWIPKFQVDNRSYLTLAIGCTGGVHRSVFLAQEIYNKLKLIQDNVILRHRELP